MPVDCSVSFVVTSRNDDHGGDMLRRFKIFAEALLEQANRHSLSGELIVVEWNPLPGPRLHEVLKLSVKSDSFTIRFIEVPPEAHRGIRNSDVIPLFQMIAKNVGIRRAKGEFVLATNPDLLFSDEVISLMSSGKLLKNIIYRIDRHDVPAEIPEHASSDVQLAWCAENVLRIHRRRGTFYPRRRLLSDILKWPWPSFAHLKNRMRFDNLATRLAAIFYQPRRLIRRILWGVLRLTDPLPKIHTNGCGDFTLMAKDQWFALRGYPELPLWSMHIDSLLCYMAVASGLRERVLRAPAKMYHMEHHNSWVVMTAEQRLKTFTVKPWIDSGLLSEIWAAMYESREPVKFNTDGWGLSEWALDEVSIVSGAKRFVRGDRTSELRVG